MAQTDSNPGNDQLNAALADLRSDNCSGAAELLRRAANVFALLRASQPQTVEPATAQQTILETAAALIRAQPDMATFARLADSALQAASRAAHSGEAFHLAEQATAEFVARMIHSAEQAATHAAALIGDGATVITNSRSSTVLAAFKQAHRAGRRFHVIATESRPMMEGCVLAETLADEGISITLIADAATALMMPQATCVMVGADRVTPEAIVNKIGTRLMALAARACGVKIYALCDTSKFIADLPASPDANRPSDELWPDAPPQVEIINRYFEPTPIGDFTDIISEDGLLAPLKASRHAARHPISLRLLAALSET